MRARRWRKGNRGQGLVEYSLILLFVAMAVFTTLFLMGPTVAGFLGSAVDSFPS
jgi:Flp pilus assembly pilin Flp